MLASTRGQRPCGRGLVTVEAGKPAGPSGAQVAAGIDGLTQREGGELEENPSHHVLTFSCPPNAGPLSGGPDMANTQQEQLLARKQPDSLIKTRVWLVFQAYFCILNVSFFFVAGLGGSMAPARGDMSVMLSATRSAQSAVHAARLPAAARSAASRV